MAESIKPNSKESAPLKLTPHTLRLIRLITSSSSSPDNDHTQHAIAILSNISSKSHPLLLWDILARLYASLTNTTENNSRDCGGVGVGNDCVIRRECIALAMEHVAKYIPIVDRRYFMTDASAVECSTGESNDDKMWLTVHDLLPSQKTDDTKHHNCEKKEDWDTLEQVLQNGRLLLASSGAQYDNNLNSSEKLQSNDYEKEDAMLSSLDTSTLISTSTEEQDKLLTERIALQRKILASRLGFGGFLSTNINTNDLVEDEDLIDCAKHNTTNTTEKEDEIKSQKKLSSRERNLLRIEKRKRNGISSSSNMMKKTKKMKSDRSDDTGKYHEHQTNEDEEEDSDDDEGEKLTIRNILLLSLNQGLHSTSRQNTNKASSPISHKTPQNILATDMIYNSVHPSWHVRHGSLLGLLALLKSWNNTSDKDEVQDGVKSQPTECFGKWPQDILTRCLCILALDRFGDFSGSTVKIKRDKGVDNPDNPDNYDSQKVEISAAMAAPVREVAARVLSFLLEMAPSTHVQKPSHRILVRLAQCNLEWEVRHGAMLGFKFIAQVIATDSHSKTLSCHHHLDKIWNSISSDATKGLQDQSDDVKGASAQVLSCMINKLTNIPCSVQDQVQSKQIISCCVDQTWTSLKEAETTSSCTLDLLNLFSSMISIDSNLVLKTMSILGSKTSDNADELLRKMNAFLYFDDYSVRLRCFESLSIIAEPIASAFANEKTKRNGNQTLQLYCKLLVNMFDSYMNDTHCDDDDYYDDKMQEMATNQGDCGRQSSRYVINATRDKAWKAIIDATILLISDEDFPLIRETATILLFRLIQVHFSQSLQGDVDHNFIKEADLKSKTSAYYKNLHSGANAFIEFYKKIGRFIDIDTTIIAFIVGLIESPFIQFCEAGCILLKFVAKSKDDKSCILISACVPFLLAMLQKGAKSMIFDCDETMDHVRNDARFIQYSTKLLVISNAEVLHSQSEKIVNHDVIDEIVKKMTQLWSEVFKVFDIDLNQNALDLKKKSKQHMRLSSSIVGAIISFGPDHLPEKLTSIIRTLMNSIKNEDVTSRAQKSCEDLVSIVHSLRQSAKQQAINKIVDKICKWASNDPQIGRLPPDFTLHGMIASREVLKMFVRSIPQHKDLTYEGQLWCQLQCLKSTNPSTLWYDTLAKALLILCQISSSFIRNTRVYDQVISDLLPTSMVLSCIGADSFVRQKAAITTINIVATDPMKSIPNILPFLLLSLNTSDDDAQRLGASFVLSGLVEKLGVALLPFVHCVLPITMSMMTDPVERCSKSAASTFAKLVRLAPLVNTDNQASTDKLIDSGDGSFFRQVVDHLIHGKPLPPAQLPPKLLQSLQESKIKLRGYQKEGISWMLFLRTLNLNGALTDEMGLGKTLQALCAVATAHLEEPLSNKQLLKKPKSLIVCPSSVVGHWMNEIKRIDKNSRILKPLRYVGSSRSQLSKEFYASTKINIIVTSYSILRSDVEILSGTSWMYCILDEGHLVKNPKTLTAKAAQRIRSRHKLLLSGSPVQNKVEELWAIFNWLMPNYLGSTAEFAGQFGKDITKGQLPGASVTSMRKGMKKLNILHQQVLPFILRRNKSEVLQQLPPKIITNVPCTMSTEQLFLYDKLSNKKDTKNAIKSLETFIEKNDTGGDPTEIGKKIKLGEDVLKSLMYLRMLCTHPLLLKGSIEVTGDLLFDRNHHSIHKYDASGKITVLKDLLGTAGIWDSEITAADNDQSLIYVSKLSDHDNSNTEEEVSTNFEYTNEEDTIDYLDNDGQKIERDDSKCLIFAQFNHSLDILEELLFKPLMPSLRYVRLDGRVDVNKRDQIVNQFVTDESVKVMLLTTKVGSLGLNLQVADTVIFLEPDYNPHVDLQAMDRVHRIGQGKTVKVYRLITTNSIEEKIMSLQTAKLAISDAIVNTDNSTMFSMGTDKLLDLFDSS